MFLVSFYGTGGIVQSGYCSIGFSSGCVVSGHMSVGMVLSGSISSGALFSTVFPASTGSGIANLFGNRCAQIDPNAIKQILKSNPFYSNDRGW